MSKWERTELECGDPAIAKAIVAAEKGDEYLSMALDELESALVNGLDGGVYKNLSSQYAIIDAEDAIIEYMSDLEYLKLA